MKCKGYNMRDLIIVAGLLIPAIPALAQNVETRVQTRVETQVDTVVKSGSAPGGTDISYDEVSFNAVGNAKTEKDAAIEAYSTGLNKILRQLAGAQAESEIGQKFRDDMERDFTSFKRRYFTSDTAHVCRPLDRENKPIPEKDKKTPVSAFSCRADGTIKVLALKQDFQRLMKSTERTLSNVLNFVVSYAETKNSPQGPYVADKLTASFLGSGFKVLSTSGEEQAILDDKVDYSLAINAIDFAQFSYSPNEQLMSGALTVRFKLYDIKNKTQVASVPVTVKQSMRGPNSDPVRVELQEKLANAAAQEIGRQTASAVVNAQVAREGDAKAQARAETGQKQYVVRIIGISPRDRKQLAELRAALKAAVPDALPEVNTGETNDTLVTINFVTANPKLDPEDVLDKLFDAYKANKSFDAKYKGNNEFSVTF